MKQTQTHVWSLAGEEAVSYSLARGKAAAVTRESGEVLGSGVLSGASSLLDLALADLGRAAPGQLYSYRGKTPKPLLSCLPRYIDTVRGARALKIT